MEVKSMQDKRNMFLLLGCYANDLKLMLQEETKTNSKDYGEPFHSIIFGALYNLAKKGYPKATSVELETEISVFNNCLDIYNKNNGQEYIELAIEETQDKLINAKYYRDSVRKYSIVRVAKEDLKLDVSFIYNEEDEMIMSQFNSMTSQDIVKIINERLSKFKEVWEDDYVSETRFNIGDDIEDLVNKFKSQEQVFGYSFQNAYINTITKGMNKRRLVIFSSKSGGGKSRLMLGESCNIGHTKMYNWSSQKWLDLGEAESVLYISTELTKQEMQTACLAHISGVAQERLELWEVTKEEELIIEESLKIMQEGKLYCIEMPEFTCEKIRNMTERYIINHGIEYLYFDYINEAVSLSAESYQKTGTHLRSDQILYNLSLELKKIANDFNLHVRTATQLNVKHKEEKDASSLKGSTAIVEKSDVAIISLPVTEQDLKKLEPILKKGFFQKPNFAHFCYKNRNGKWTSIIVWSRVDLSTCRETGSFCTDYEYKLITNIKPTVIDIDFTGIVNSADLIQLDDDDTSVEETISDFKKTK